MAYPHQISEVFYKINKICRLGAPSLEKPGSVPGRHAIVHILDPKIDLGFRCQPGDECADANAECTDNRCKCREGYSRDGNVCSMLHSLRDDIANRTNEKLKQTCNRVHSS